MQDGKLFEAAYAYGEEILGLPVADISHAVEWYSRSFGLSEIERNAAPKPQVLMERDGVRIGFTENGLDPSNPGAPWIEMNFNNAIFNIKIFDA